MRSPSTLHPRAGSAISPHVGSRAISAPARSPRPLMPSIRTDRETLHLYDLRGDEERLCDLAVRRPACGEIARAAASARPCTARSLVKRARVAGSIAKRRLWNESVTSVAYPLSMISEEARRLLEFEERHRRLAARLILAAGLTFVVAAFGSVLTYYFELGASGGDIHGFGDSLFFTTAQLLSVSSSIKNPLTTGGRLVDVMLEAWSIFVVTAVAGSFASFFSSGDAS